VTAFSRVARNANGFVPRDAGGSVECAVLSETALSLIEAGLADPSLGHARGTYPLSAKPTALNRCCPTADVAQALGHMIIYFFAINK
ncbi:MAG: hypothetical protein KKB85_03050, partial [Candidatus Altiarchaeota archaeon]|nr:hypothetical protein [Candidatus Altiarchaeota archaeon]